DAGANAVRVYHAAGNGLMRAAAAAKVMLIEQPDESTWSEVDPESPRERRALARRYRSMVERTEGFPYLLIDHLGNELEMGRSPSVVATLSDLMRELHAGGSRFPMAYSTYAIFADYPVDVLGVNMLDTGETYWGKGIDLLRSFGKPFYATELG